jgi:hypothetical protein
MSVGYFYTDWTNQAGTNYRLGETVGVEVSSDAGGGYDVGYTKEGEWLRYTVNVMQSGLYASKVASHPWAPVDIGTSSSTAGT